MRILGFLLVVCSVLGGCVGDSGPAFYMTGALAPDDGCAYNSGNPLLAGGRYNVTSRNQGYLLAPLYVNNLIPNEASAPPRPNPNDMIVEGAEVEIRDAAGNPVAFGGLPNPFSVTAATFVASQGTAAGALEIIPVAYAAELETILGTSSTLRLLVGVKPFAETTGHVTVDGREFVWPVDICSGTCLFEMASPDLAAGDGCCLPGQDDVCVLP